MTTNIQLSTTSAQSLADWKLAMIRMIVIYRIKVKGDRLPIDVQQTDYEFVESILDDMFNKDLLKQSSDQTHWELTRLSEQIATSMRELDDHASTFGIFANVHIGRNVSHLLDEEGNISAGIDDPRFEIIENQTKESIEEFRTEDLRIPMILFLNEYAQSVEKSTTKVDPYQMVFARMLNQGKIAEKDIWFNLRLGTFFDEVQKIVESQYNWKSITTNIALIEDPYEAGLELAITEDTKEVVKNQLLYTLASGEEILSPANGKILKAAIESDNDDGTEEFVVIEIEMDSQGHEEACQNVMSEIFKAGMFQIEKDEENLDDGEGEDGDETVATITTTTVEGEDVWGYSSVYSDPYEYYGYYDPYDPIADAIIFGACVGVIAYCW